MIQLTLSDLTGVSSSSEPTSTDMSAMCRRRCDDGTAPSNGSGIIFSGRICIRAVRVLIKTDNNKISYIENLHAWQQMHFLFSYSQSPSQCQNVKAQIQFPLSSL